MAVLVVLFGGLGWLGWVGQLVGWLVPGVYMSKCMKNYKEQPETKHKTKTRSPYRNMWRNGLTKHYCLFDVSIQ